MSVTQYERHEIEHNVFATRHEAGLQYMRTWLYAHRDTINLKWTSLTGEELLRLQGEAALVNRLIKMIDFGPSQPRFNEEMKHG